MYSDDFPLGYFEVNTPITTNSLHIPKTSGELQVSDIAILGEWIYVLDFMRGVYGFRYASNKVADVTPFLKEN